MLLSAQIMGRFGTAVKDDAYFRIVCLQLLIYPAGGFRSGAWQGAAREKDGITAFGQCIPGIAFRGASFFVVEQAGMFGNIPATGKKSLSSQVEKHCRGVNTNGADSRAETTETAGKGSRPACLRGAAIPCCYIHGQPVILQESAIFAAKGAAGALLGDHTNRSRHRLSVSGKG